MHDLYIATPINTALTAVTRIPDQCTGGMPFTTAVLDCATLDHIALAYAYELKDYLDMSEIYSAFFSDKVNGDSRASDEQRMNLYSQVMEQDFESDVIHGARALELMGILNALLSRLLTFYAWRLPPPFIAQALLELYDVTWVSPGTIAVRYVNWGKNEGFNHS